MNTEKLKLNNPEIFYLASIEACLQQKQINEQLSSSFNWHLSRQGKGYWDQVEAGREKNVPADYRNEVSSIMQKMTFYFGKA